MRINGTLIYDSANDPLGHRAVSCKYALRIGNYSCNVQQAGIFYFQMTAIAYAQKRWCRIGFRQMTPLGPGHSERKIS
jgi:hypothetical protein